MQTDMNKLFAEGGVMQEGGTVDPVSGNEVPPGAMQEEVRDDVDAKLSEGEFVMPADVVRYIGLETLMKLRDKAKMGLKKMEEIGQMGNADSVPDAEALHGGEDEMDDETFSSEIDSILGEDEGEEKEYAAGGYVAPTSAQITGQNQQATNELAASGTTTQYADAPLKGFEMVAMVNDAGQTIYIPFIDGVPQLSVPEGYKVKKTIDTTTPATDATKPTTSAQGGVASGGSGGGSDSGNTGLTKEQEATFDFMNTPEGASYKEAYGKANSGLIGSVLGFVVPGLSLALNVPKNPIEQLLTANNIFKEATIASKSVQGSLDTTNPANIDTSQPAATTGPQGTGGSAASAASQAASAASSQGAAAQGAAAQAAADVVVRGGTLSEALAAGREAANNVQAAETGMTTNAEGRTVSSDRSIAAQDEAVFGPSTTPTTTPDTSPDTGGGGGDTSGPSGFGSDYGDTSMGGSSSFDSAYGYAQGGFVAKRKNSSKSTKQKGLASRK